MSHNVGRYNAVDLIGRRFGRLIVVRFSHKSPRRAWYWLCRCDCGEASVVRTGELLHGLSRSCGCLKRVATRTHGETSDGKFSKEYAAWANMIQRCTNPEHPSYEYYGKRGITICRRWLTSFENFLSDMGKCPLPSYSLDRENNDGNYGPDNCRWAGKFTQARNRRKPERRNVSQRSNL